MEIADSVSPSFHQVGEVLRSQRGAFIPLLIFRVGGEQLSFTSLRIIRCVYLIHHPPYSNRQVYNRALSQSIQQAYSRYRSHSSEWPIPCPDRSTRQSPPELYSLAAR
jgi:hypothetical protein